MEDFSDKFINDLLEGIKVTRGLNKHYKALKDDELIQDYKIDYVECRSYENNVEHLINIHVLAKAKPLEHIMVNINFDRL
jgi:hypothetical protein